MQKIISSLIFLFSILILFLTLTYEFNVSYTKLTSKNTVSSPENHDHSFTAKSAGISTSASTPSSLYAKAYCLVNGDDGKTLLGKNETDKMPMASTTKIMTCIIALEKGNLNDIVTASSYAASMPDVQLNMQTNEQFYLKDLLYSLMLESHNDTAVAIAEHIGGSVEGFAKLMNKKAKSLGCTDTNFVTPNGLDDDNHYTTAEELCKIACYAIKNKKFLKIIKTSSHSFTNTDGTRSYNVSNKDAFLTTYNGAIGIKTGFTGNAGYCFCGAAKRNGITLVSSVLACGWPPNKSYKWADTKKLMDYGFEAYSKLTLTPDNPLPDIPVTEGQSAKVSLSRADNKSYELLLTEKDNISFTYELPSCLKAPVTAGDTIGYENIKINDSQYTRISLIASDNVAAADFEMFFQKIFKLFTLSNC